MSISDKADYFEAISNEVAFQGIINTGQGNINIDSTSYKYAPGAVIGNVAGSPKVIVNNSNPELINSLPNRMLPKITGIS